jgi:hypothetical protein
LYSWFVLRRQGLLDIGRETVILLMAAAGFGAGYGADLIARLVFHLH